jgi:hypothetical protein
MPQKRLKGREPVQRRADKTSALHVKAVDHGAHHHALAEGGEQEPPAKE